MEARIEAWRTNGQLSEPAADAVLAWLSEPPYEAFTDEICGLIDQGDTNELEDAFRTHIAFGTGGIRGKMGPGPNRINLRIIGEAAQGLARYILKETGDDGARRGVAVANDTRNNSTRFAREVARILAANGITAYLFETPRATPELSFAVREIGAVAGVVISASHNPPRDNGFKAYWSDGGQVIPPHDKAIMAEAEAVTDIPPLSFEQAASAGRVKILGDEVDTAYITKTQLNVTQARDVSIVFSPLHGVGATSVVPALKKLGFGNVHVVATQNDQDGNFPTVTGGVSNPEDPKALTLAIEKAAELDADLVLATDPDADRLGCAVPLPDLGWAAEPSELAIDGNRIGVVLCHYLLSRLAAEGAMPDRPVVAETIVTTDLTGLVARAFGARVVDNLLVGFKYITEVINHLENEETFVFGAEESHGYLATDLVREKDAASAAMLFAQCAADAKARGETIRDQLDAIYRYFGYFREIQKSVTREGATGSQDIQNIMASLRESPPAKIGKWDVITVIDRLEGTSRRPYSGEQEQVDGDRGNVLAFALSEAGHTRVTARPSGTEPKIKYYVSASSLDLSGVQSTGLDETKCAVDAAAAEILDATVELAERAVR